VAGSVLLGAAFFALGPQIIDLMATDPTVRETARHFLPWLAAAPVIGIAAWMFDGIFIGATRTADMRNAMLASAAVYAVALAILLPAFGNHGLWAALMVLNATRGVTLALLYPRIPRALDAARPA
jgi:MATE family multidrug resistance protein